MLSRRPCSLLCVAVAGTLILSSACERVPLLAPTGSTITLTASASTLSSNGSTAIIAQLLEAGGSPPHSGTHVTFTTTLGRIDPPEAETDINGRVTAVFYAGGANGLATIGALSGGATTGANGSLKIAVGTAAVGRVSVGALPASLPPTGGASTISAVVLDLNGNPLAGTAVSFSTSAGTLSASIASTNADGTASTILTSSQAATVTATVGIAGAPGAGRGSSGGVTGSVSVGVAGAPTVSIAPPATVFQRLPATFTFTVTPASSNGAAIRDLVVNWGDGIVENLGAVFGASSQVHLFQEEGSYRVTATITDVSGNGNAASSSVVVQPVARPSILVAYSPAAPSIGTEVVFTITITTPAGLSVRSTSIDYGDGHSDELGGTTSAARTHAYDTAGTRMVTVKVLDSTGRTSEGTTSVVIKP